jgi:hypothetical protein
VLIRFFATRHWEQHKDTVQWVRDFVKQSGIPPIDVVEAFSSVPKRERRGLFIPGDVHCSVQGNLRAAQVIAAAARALVTGFPDAVVVPRVPDRPEGSMGPDTDQPQSRQAV